MKKNSKSIRHKAPVHDATYCANQESQDNYIKGEKLIPPFYIDKEEVVCKNYVINYILKALKILSDEGSLCELTRQEFKNLISELLHNKKDWLISGNFTRKNTHQNLITTKWIDNIGTIGCVWLVRKYSEKRKVSIAAVRELEYIINKTNTSKGGIITTSKLTRPAIKLINESTYRMFYIDIEMLKKELAAYNK